MMNEGNEMKTALTAAEIVELIKIRMSECIELSETFKRLGKRKMAYWYEGEVAACSTILWRIEAGK